MYDVARHCSLVRRLEEHPQEDKEVELQRVFEHFEVGLQAEDEPRVSIDSRQHRRLVRTPTGRRPFVSSSMQTDGSSSAIFGWKVPLCSESDPFQESRASGIEDPHGSTLGGRLAVGHFASSYMVYALLRSPCTQRYFLSVLCGSVGMYTVNIELMPEEIRSFPRERKVVCGRVRKTDSILVEFCFCPENSIPKRLDLESR